MMNEVEREAARLGMSALDAALVALGRSAVAHNSDFRVAEPVILDFPLIALEKPDVAPLEFLFGLDLDMRVGPFSELLLLPVEATKLDSIQETLQRIFRSSVAYKERTWSRLLTMQLGDAEPWLRVTNLGRLAGGPSLEPFYAAYVA